MMQQIMILLKELYVINQSFRLMLFIVADMFIKLNNSDKSGRKKNIKDVDAKIPDTSGLTKKTDYNAEDH